MEGVLFEHRPEKVEEKVVFFCVVLDGFFLVLCLLLLQKFVFVDADFLENIMDVHFQVGFGELGVLFLGLSNKSTCRKKVEIVEGTVHRAEARQNSDHNGSEISFLVRKISTYHVDLVFEVEEVIQLENVPIKGRLLKQPLHRLLRLDHPANYPFRNSHHVKQHYYWNQHFIVKKRAFLLYYSTFLTFNTFFIILNTIIEGIINRQL